MRLQKERDEAREALAKVSVDGVGKSEAMDIDEKSADGLPTEILQKIDQFKEEYCPFPSWSIGKF